MLRQAWELDDAAKAEKLIRNLARRLEQDRPGVAASILEGLDEILTVVRLKLPMQLRRSLACTNIAENMMGTIRRVTRNVKRWRNGNMALRWVAAGMIEAAKGFRKLKAHKQLDTKPIFHQSDAAIRGHVFCSFLALMLAKELMCRCEEKGLRPEWQPLLNDLDRLQQATIEKDGKVITTRTHVAGQVGNVFKAAGIALPPNLDEQPA